MSNLVPHDNRVEGEFLGPENRSNLERLFEKLVEGELAAVDGVVVRVAKVTLEQGFPTGKVYVTVMFEESSKCLKRVDATTPDL